MRLRKDILRYSNRGTEERWKLLRATILKKIPLANLHKIRKTSEIPGGKPIEWARIEDELKLVEKFQYMKNMPHLSKKLQNTSVV